jgi:hypothetical protein
MSPLKYCNGELVMLGDRVIVRRARWFGLWPREQEGTVNWVFDSTKPVVREVNDYGFSIRFGNRSSIWVGGQPDSTLALIERSHVR